MVMTVRFVIGLADSFEEEEIGFVRGNGASGLAQVVDRYELSKSGAREGHSFIIGGRRERVREIPLKRLGVVAVDVGAKS
jgi:hypothetical protein